MCYSKDITNDKIEILAVNLVEEDTAAVQAANPEPIDIKDPAPVDQEEKIVADSNINLASFGDNTIKPDNIEKDNPAAQIYQSQSELSSNTIIFI